MDHEILRLLTVRELDESGLPEVYKSGVPSLLLLRETDHDESGRLSNKGEPFDPIFPKLPFLNECYNVKEWKSPVREGVLCNITGIQISAADDDHDDEDANRLFLFPKKMILASFKVVSACGRAAITRSASKEIILMPAYDFGVQ